MPKSKGLIDCPKVTIFRDRHLMRGDLRFIYLRHRSIVFGTLLSLSMRSCFERWTEELLLELVEDLNQK